MLTSLAPDPLTRADTAPRANCAPKTYHHAALRTLYTAMCDTLPPVHMHELQWAEQRPRWPFSADLPALLPACSPWVSRSASPAQGPHRVSQVPLGCGGWARAAHRRSREGEQALDGTPSLIAQDAGGRPGSGPVDERTAAAAGRNGRQQSQLRPLRSGACYAQSSTCRGGFA